MGQKTIGGLNGPPRGRRLASDFVFSLLFLAPLAPIQSTETKSPCNHLGIETVNWKSPDNHRTGVLILSTLPGCMGAEMGVRAGEVLVGFNGKPVGSRYELEALAEGHTANLGFSVTLEDARGSARTLKRRASKPPERTLSRSGWAWLFLAMSLSVTPLIGRLPWQNAKQARLIPTRGSGYENIDASERLDTDQTRRTRMRLGMLLTLLLAGPIGLACNLASLEELSSGNGAEPLLRAADSFSAISLYRDPGFNLADIKMLKRLAGRYPTEILASHPQIAEALKVTLGKSYQPLMEMLIVQTPARTTPDGGLSFFLCKAHACPDAQLFVYVSPSLKVSALLFHNDREIDLPETPAQGEIAPDNWSRLVLYEQTAFPPMMPLPLYQAAMTELDQLQDFSLDGKQGRLSSRFWIVGKLQ